MDTHLSVTNIEYELPEGASLVSRTDLKGRIIYVNSAFIEASQYSETELLGNAHSIIRHPDMPPELFADLWSTLAEGLPWTGIIKNQRQNGDHFWVNANITPVRRKGVTIAYMSASTRPSREQISTAEEVYRRFKEGKAGDLIIHHGAATSNSPISRLISIRRIPINLRILITTSLGALLMAGVGAFGWLETNALVEASGKSSVVPTVIAVAGGGGAILSILFGYFIT
nr:PAS domain-containing protein [Gammaproteobacteria bacterium]